MHCMELKGEKTNFIGREIDDQCINKTAEKKKTEIITDGKIPKKSI